jgi:hypothetical protein
MKQDTQHDKNIQITILIIFPFMMLILLILKLICIHIFSMREFKTHSFRCIKFISTVDALSLFILMLIPFVESQN